MPVPSSINDLSTTAGSNSPAGSETPSEGDNYLRTYGAFIALLRDKLNGTSDTGTVKNATFSGTMAGAASWSGLQTFLAGIGSSNAGYLTTPAVCGVVAYRGSTQTLSAGTNTVIFDTESADRDTDYDNATGIFTAPVTGLYQINVNLKLQNATVSPLVLGSPYISKNNVTTAGNFVSIGWLGVTGATVNGAGNSFEANASAMFLLTASDTLRTKIEHTGADLSVLANSHLSIAFVG